MPRQPARIRRRITTDDAGTLDWELEETLVFGCVRVFGPPVMLKRRADWVREWNRYRDVVLPKVIEHRPGTRPFAMYAVGELPPRELAIPLSDGHCYWRLIIDDANGKPVTHWLNVDEAYMPHEVHHLRRLGVCDDAEFRRFRNWRDADERLPYPLEMSAYT